MENTLRAPWTAERSPRWWALWNVYDCDGNVIAENKIEEVAQLIAEAPATKALLDKMLEPTISVYADPKQYNLSDWLPSNDPHFSKDDDGAIEDELLRAEGNELDQDDFPAETLAEGWLAAAEDDDPGETFLDYGEPGAGDIGGREMESADVEYDYWWLQT